MSGGEIAAYVVGLGTFFTGLAALLTARSTRDKNVVEGKTIGETALANAVQVVEDIYDKVTKRLNTQIEELLHDNQTLRDEVHGLRTDIEVVKENERKCRSEVALLRMEVQGKAGK